MMSDWRRQDIDGMVEAHYDRLLEALAEDAERQFEHDADLYLREEAFFTQFSGEDLEEGTDNDISETASAE